MKGEKERIKGKGAKRFRGKRGTKKEEIGKGKDMGKAEERGR